MTARYIAIGMLIVTLGVAGAFLAIIYLRPNDEPPNSGAPSVAESINAPMAKRTFTGIVSGWQLDGEWAVTRDGAYQLTFAIKDSAGQPAPPSLVPTVQVEMLDHAMGTDIPRVQVERGGQYRSVGTLEMYGRWRLRILVGAEAVDEIVDFRR